jgi:HAD superfamily hydrolase (TIGR01484 family)
VTAVDAITLVVTDLDGTLWDAGEVIHDRTLAALHELERRAVPLLVATGRRPRSAAAGLARHGLAPPAVVLDGAIGRNLATGEVFHEAAFARADAVAVLTAFEAAGVSPCVYVDRADVDVVVGDAPSTHPRHLEFIGPWLARADLHAVVASERVFSIGVAGRDPHMLDGVAARVGGSGETAVTRDLVLGGATLMVRPRGVSKWAGVVAFCTRQGLDPARVLAVGDGENDVELLEAAAVSCVVSDGCDAALALADHVIEPAGAGGWSTILSLV